MPSGGVVFTVLYGTTVISFKKVEISFPGEHDALRLSVGSPDTHGHSDTVGSVIILGEVREVFY